jgi:23S rRNA (guanosine2251-2'-O)-methyltransferase
MKSRLPNHSFHKRKSFDNLVFGRQPVIELLDTEKTVDKILIHNGADGEAITKIKKQAAEKEIPLKYVPVEKLNQLTGGIHQGVIAFTTEIEFQKIENILPHIIEQGKIPLFILLDGITDVRNFGAIARTAYAAGADALIIHFADTAPLNEEAIKTSAGALTKIAVCRERNLLTVLDFLKLNGIQIIGTERQGSKKIYETNLNVPCAIVLGSEDEGISYDVRKYIDLMVSIPIMNEFNSYNVSVAAGMILYEAMKQRLIS